MAGERHVGRVEARVGVRTAVGVGDMKHELPPRKRDPALVADHCAVPPALERGPSASPGTFREDRQIPRAVTDRDHAEPVLRQQVPRIHRARGVEKRLVAQPELLQQALRLLRLMEQDPKPDRHPLRHRNQPPVERRALVLQQGDLLLQSLEKVLS